ncbi:MAG: response regulator transcription factor [Bacteroidales bacterium]|nr:response regulator transcription factor [Bacteroidales bacterium]
MTQESNYRVLIIDDEPPARQIIRDYLKAYPNLSIEGEYSDGFSGLKAIQEVKPDLIFLDIQMPKLTGFELLDLLDDPPLLIFSTAYDQFAIKAFEQNAIDYLLKPYSRDRFAQAVEKALTSLNAGTKEPKSVEGILETVNEQPDLLARIAVKIRHKVHVIPVQEIRYLEADGDYVTIHTEKDKFLKEKTMKYFETHLDPGRFIRIHRSAIINVEFMDKLEYYDKESYAVLMKDGARLKASTSGYKVLKEALKL